MLHRWKIVCSLCVRVYASSWSRYSFHLHDGFSRKFRYKFSFDSIAFAIDRSTNKRLPVFHTYIHTSITIGVAPREFSRVFFCCELFRFRPRRVKISLVPREMHFFNSLCILSCYKRKRPRLDFGLLRAVILPWNGFS